MAWQPDFVHKFVNRAIEYVNVSVHTNGIENYSTQIISPLTTHKADGTAAMRKQDFQPQTDAALYP
jgi:hypothetical protein